MSNLFHDSQADRSKRLLFQTAKTMRRPERVRRTTVRRLAELSDQGVEWKQPAALRMDYELRDGDEVAATLRFKSSFGTLATAESADGCWTFKRVGFFHTRVTIRTCNEENEIAVFKNNTWSGGGTLELPDGRRILATTNFWQTQLDFRTESGQTIVQLKSGGVFHLSATVDIDRDGFKMGEPWIVILGWYLIVMMHMDAGAAAAT